MSAPDLFDLSTHRSFSLLAYAGSKGGKTWLGYTTPGPRLIFDTEGGRSSRFVPPGVKRMIWDPYLYGPPEPSAAWDSCVVYVRSVADLEQVMTHLEGKVHPFRSVVLDSLWELQQQYVTDAAGVNQMKLQDWGDVLRRLLNVVNRLRDLCVAPISPISVFMVTTAEREKDGRVAPYLQGQLQGLIAYKFDVVGYLFRWTDPETMTSYRRVLVSEDAAVQQWLGLTGTVVAGEAVGGALGYMTEPNVSQMLDTIYNGTPTAAPVAPTAAPPQNAED